MRVRLKLLGYLVWVLGIAAVLLLLATRGFDSVLEAMAVAGWGILLVCVVQMLPMLADAYAWRLLLPAPEHASVGRLFWIRWIGESVNNLLPVATVAGEFLRAWMLRNSTPITGPMAGASVIGDMTLGLASQVLFTLMGVVLLAEIGGHGDIALAAMVGMLLLSVGLVGFFYAQQAGLFAFTSKMVVRVARQERWLLLIGSAEELDGAIKDIYRRRSQFAIALLLRLAGWCAGAIEVWLGFWFLGHPVSIADALMVESLVRAVRSAAFMVPGALGLQEGGLIVLGGVIGLSPEVSLALALLKRVRELLWGVPGLLMWQFSQLHRAWVGRVGNDQTPAAQPEQD